MAVKNTGTAAGTDWAEGTKNGKPYVANDYGNGDVSLGPWSKNFTKEEVKEIVKEVSEAKR